MITYRKGDATSPQANGTKLIVHIVNNEGGWGAGFVVAISKRWKEPEAMYRQWYRQNEPINNPEVGSIVQTTGRFGLGESQLVMVEPGLAVVNMVAQQGYVSRASSIAVRYDALRTCLESVSSWAEYYKASVHMPRIGCALGGGRWSEVEPIIQETLSGKYAYVYDYGPYNP